MIKFNIKSFLFLFFIIISTGLIILGMKVLNDNVIKIGLLELNGFINDMNREESHVDYMGMMSKFKLHMDFYKDEIDQHEFNEGELKVAMAVSSYTNSVLLYDQKKYGFFSNVLLLFINFIRMLLDKPPLSYDFNNQTDTELLLAYYYERNNYYDKALNIYDKALQKSDSDQNKVPIILLHRGFCLALTMNTDKAKDQLKDVIKRYNNESAAFTAATLLQYILYFEKEIQKTKESDEDSIKKSEKLYKLIAYSDAIEVLDTIIIEDEEQKEKIQYIKARCYEESGEKEEALDIYQEIIEENSESELAKSSNTRLLIIGTIDKTLEQAKKLAEENNKEIQDPKFTEIHEVTEKYEEVTGDNYEVQYIEQEIKESSETEEPTPVTTATPTSEITPTPLMTPIPTPIITLTPTPIRTATPTPAITPTPTLLRTATPTPVITLTPTPLRTATPTPVRTATPTPVITPTPTPLSTPVPTKTPTGSVPPTLNEVKTVNDDGSFTISHQAEDGSYYKVEYYDESGSLQNYIEYIYDEEGNIIGIVKKDKNGNIIE